MCGIDAESAHTDTTYLYGFTQYSNFISDSAPPTHKVYAMPTHTNHTGQHSSTRYGEASCRSYLTKSLLARQITINDECLLEDSARLEQHARVLGGGLRAEVAVRVHLADCFLLNASLIAASVEGRVCRPNSASDAMVASCSATGSASSASSSGGASEGGSGECSSLSQSAKMFWRRLKTSMCVYSTYYVGADEEDDR